MRSGGGEGGNGGGGGGGNGGEGGGGRACFMYVRWLPARCVPVHDLTAEQVNQIAPSLARDLTTMSPMQRALASQRRRHSGRWLSLSIAFMLHGVGQAPMQLTSPRK